MRLRISTILFFAAASLLTLPGLAWSVSINVIPPVDNTAGVSPATYIIAASDSKNPGKADFAVPAGDPAETTINQAVNALPSLGGRILLMEGTFDLSTPVIVNGAAGTKVNVAIEGFGNGTRIKKRASGFTGTALIQNASGSNVTGLSLRKLGVTADATVGGIRLAGGTISDVEIVQNNFSDVTIVIDPGNAGANTGGGTGAGVAVRDNIFRDTDSVSRSTLISIYDTAGAILTSNVIADAAIDFRYVTGAVITDNSTTSTSPAFAFISDNVTGAVVSGNNFGTTSSSASVAGGQGFVFASNKILASTSSLFTVGQLAVVSGNNLKKARLEVSGPYNIIAGNTIATAVGSGITATSSQAVYNLVRDNNISSSSQHGISLIDARHSLVTANVISFSGQAATNTYAGVYVGTAGAGTCDYNSIQGNLLRRGTGIQPRHGIWIADPSCDGNFVVTNDLRTSGATSSYQDSGTATVTATTNRQ